MAITFVRALWGDELVATWPKTMRDIAYCKDWRHTPDIGAKAIVFAYGRQNKRFLTMYGVDAMLIHRKAVVDFDGVGSREHDGRGILGIINYGLSMWVHKTYAIRRAFAFGATEVIWLDWDTLYRGEEKLEYYDTFKDGPEFQSRMRGYKKPISGGGRRWAYHGGCYYFRSPRVCEEADRLRKAARYVTDEALITTAINNMYFDGREATPQEHRDAGFDNPLLHSTRVNAVKCDEQSLYKESKLIRGPRFLAKMKTPKYTPTRAGQ